MRKLFFITCTMILGSWFAKAQDAFREITSMQNISHRGGNRGVAIGDFDNDGDDDIYICVIDGANQLLKNLGNDQFVDVADAAHVNYGEGSRTAVWGDIDNDGDLDLYVANYNKNDVLYLNNGDGTFSDITQSAGIHNMELPFSVNMCDVDRDGFLDIYIANFRTQNILYHNNGDKTFSNYIYASGALDDQLSMGAVFFDYDNDGDSDLYLTHDGNVPNILYQNDGKGHFTNVSVQSGANYVGQGMGADFGDINNDGYFDIYITNLYANALLLNNGDGTFTNIAADAGVNDNGMSWGCNFLDFNNDGKTDIYLANDSYFSPYPNALFQNMGNNHFETVKMSMVASMQGTYGSAFGDFNQDGFTDLVLANSGQNDYVQIFENMGNANHWIGFKLEGVQSNRSAIGARVTITDESGLLQMDEVTAGSGYAAQNSMALRFGLGESQNITSGFVTWPNGLKQEFSNLEAGFYYKIKEGEIPEKVNTITTAVNNLPFDIANFVVFPNPASSEVNIHYSLQKPAVISVSIWNAFGQLVEKWSPKQSASGNYTLSWNPATTGASGIYFVKIASEGQAIVKRVVVQ